MVVPTDIDLVTRIKNGDTSAFEPIVGRYRDRIFTLCRYMLYDKEDVQDAAQEVFLKVYRSLERYSPDSSFYTWLYRIAVNVCIDYNKKLRPALLDAEFLDAVPSLDPSPEHLYESKETGRVIEEALNRLPDNLKMAIILKEIDGFSYEEIAEVLNISIGTVKSRISRAREKLRWLLRKIT